MTARPGAPVTALTPTRGSGRAGHSFGLDPDSAAAPSPLPALRWWLKGSAITGVPDSSTLQNWPDSGTLGRPARQPSAAQRPAYKSSAINTQPAVLFTNSGGQRMQGSGIYAVTQPFMVFIVCKESATSGDHCVIDMGFRVYATGTKWAMKAASGTEVVSTFTRDTSAHLIEAVFNGGSSEMLVDAASVASSNPGAADSSTSTTVGDNTDNTARFLGHIAEIRVYQGIPADRTTIRSDLKTLYGTP